MFHRSFLLNVALLGVSIALSAGLIELMVRVYYGDKFGARPPFWVTDELVGWRPRPNLDHTFHGRDFQSSIRTDGSGRRLGELGEVSEPSDLVITLGDSYTFGWGVNTDQTFPSYLDQALAASSDCRVINLGVGGYGTLQSARRLAELASTADRRVNHSTIKAVVMMHSHNDMTDNVRFLQFVARWIAHDEDARNLSNWHSWNLVRHAKRWLRRRLDPANGATDMPFEPVDQLAGFQRKETAHLEPVVLPGGRQLSPDDITAADLDPRQTIDRGYLTPLQENLLRASVEELNCALNDQRMPIVHAVIHSAPVWYVEALRRMVGEADACGNQVTFVGAVPSPSGCEQCGFNQHSGGHFNPPLNKHYAEYIEGLLHSRDLCGEARAQPTH